MRGGGDKTGVREGRERAAEKHGKRERVCERDARGNLADVCETGGKDVEPRQIVPNLWAM